MAFMDDPLSRAAAFCDQFGIRVPILLAPMAGACPPSSSIAVMRAGGFGACAALLMQPKEIEDWATEVRANVDGPFQINLWIPDPPPVSDRSHEARVREFLSLRSAANQAAVSRQIMCLLHLERMRRLQRHIRRNAG
jgi:nitronate monooxygenase